MLKKIDRHTLNLSSNRIKPILGMTAEKADSFHIDKAIDKQLTKSDHLIHPLGVWEIFPINRLLQENKAILGDNSVLEGSSIMNHLAGCSYAGVLAATIGVWLEKKVDALFADNEYLKAVILDAIGSEAAENTIDILNTWFLEEQGLVQGQYTKRYSPGYGDWNIEIQRDLLSLAKAERIGMKVNDASILIPRKSVTAVVGFKENR